MNKYLLTIFSLALCGGVQADVQLSIRDASGVTNTLSSNGQKVRIDFGRMTDYGIIDYAGGMLYLVDFEDNEIMQANLETGGAGTPGEAVSLTLNDQGDGKKIAGYQTRKYELIADGENCGHVYASSKLLKNKDVRSIFEAGRSLQRFTRGMMSGFSSMLSACQRAGMQMADAAENKGAPLLVLDASGKVVSEVTSVNTDKQLAANHYELPSDLKIVDMNEKIDQAVEQTQQIMENMPDMNQLMEQLQQSGGQMTEEQQQQIKKAMEMYQQQLQ